MGLTTEPTAPTLPIELKPRAPRSGLIARQIALEIVSDVLTKRRSLDDALDRVMRQAIWQRLEPRDRGFARVLAMAVLRHHGSLSALLLPLMRKALPDEAHRIDLILKMGAVQLLELNTPAHAVIDLAVEQTRAQAHGVRFTGLVNAVLRRLSKDGAALWAALDHPVATTPDWLWHSWVDHFGETTARAFATAHTTEAALDLSIKHSADAAYWAGQLNGVVLASGTVRVAEAGNVEALPGYAEGAWWVQDAAAALPVRLLGDVAGRVVADLCAAPGGKTAQLVAAGAIVTALDASRPRLARLQANLDRLGLVAECVLDDLDNWRPDRQFDAILLDAPCSATGTIRRHPDVALHRTPDEILRHATRQRRLLGRTVPLLAPGGVLVFCTCSLEAAEGEAHVAPFLADYPEMQLDPIHAGDTAIDAVWIGPLGTLRTLPSHHPVAADPHTGIGPPGMDGFFAARFRKSA
jgi:16S rRNA (cytosine967-C5)-methyltransferase